MRFLFLLLLHTYTFPVYVKGHVRQKFEQSSIPAKHISVFVREKGKIVAQTKTDDKGDFSFSWTPELNVPSYFYAVRSKADTVLLKKVSAFESDTPELTFYIPKKKS